MERTCVRVTGSRRTRSRRVYTSCMKSAADGPDVRLEPGVLRRVEAVDGVGARVVDPGEHDVVARLEARVVRRGEHADVFETGTEGSARRLECPPARRRSWNRLEDDRVAVAIRPGDGTLGRRG